MWDINHKLIIGYSQSPSSERINEALLAISLIISDRLIAETHSLSVSTTRSIPASQLRARSEIIVRCFIRIRRLLHYPFSANLFSYNVSTRILAHFDQKGLQACVIFSLPFTSVLQALQNSFLSQIFSFVQRHLPQNPIANKRSVNGKQHVL